VAARGFERRSTVARGGGGGRLGQRRRRVGVAAAGQACVPRRGAAQLSDSREERRGVGR
jgi:hypothetical protein